MKVPDITIISMLASFELEQAWGWETQKQMCIFDITWFKYWLKEKRNRIDTF